MGPKYEFTDGILNYNDHVLHQIRRLSDGKIGGWIESEENLSQEGSCWVDAPATVYDGARVYGNAQVYDDADIYGNAQVYGDAEISWEAEIYGNAKVFDNADIAGRAKISGNAEIYGYVFIRDDVKVYDDAKVYDEARIGHYAEVYGNAEVYGHAEVKDHAQVYGEAKVYGNAQVCGDAKVYGNAIIDEDCIIDSGEHAGDYYKDDVSNNIVQDFIYKVNESNKFEVKTEYSSIDEYVNSAYQNDSKLDTLIICTVDTKIPIIKLEKIEKDKQLKYKFIVDLTTENEEHFLIQSFIETKEQLSQKLTQTIDALNQYPEFSKYVDDLENCL